MQGKAGTSRLLAAHDVQDGLAVQEVLLNEFAEYTQRTAQHPKMGALKMSAVCV